MTTVEQRLTRPTKRTVKLSEIHARPDEFQYRDNEYENHHVEEIAEAIRRKGSVDRVDLWRDAKNGKLVVVDGHHRRQAYKRAGVNKVPAIVWEGSAEAARLHALRENAKARLPMTATEKNNATWRLACQTDCSGAYTYSKRVLVESTGAADGTVGNMRRSRRRLLEADKPLPETWWGALAALKDLAGKELTDDDRDAMVEERARRLDDRVGKDIGNMAEIQIEAVIKMLEKRLGQKTRILADWWREDAVEGWPY
ncbi:ParB/RepB/Spo0J family partition protein [Palleronia sp. LCG004]|uniref:ParB/RepB/Spo0J family partition protein n=1 Tax=Palleronia sp. LCG004 TaxID=3079304 RepID=UPI0029430EA3|nr:ParB N-terminal domain-containing protein [Palleronia sp. LCG004]WOI55587.1 ParB N-terminal domain-containing protein [Palleronia sp. LCG004]